MKTYVFKLIRRYNKPSPKTSEASSFLDVFSVSLPMSKPFLYLVGLLNCKCFVVFCLYF